MLAVVSGMGGGPQFAVMTVPTCSPVNMLAGERAGEIAGDEAVNDPHLADVTRLPEQIEDRKFEDRILQPPRGGFQNALMRIAMMKMAASGPERAIQTRTA